LVNHKQNKKNPKKINIKQMNAPFGILFKKNTLSIKYNKKANPGIVITIHQ